MIEPQPERRFVLCVENKDSDDLEKRKVYVVLADEGAEKEGYLRVIDESGEDYLFPDELFAAIRISRAVSRKLASAT